MKGWLRVYAPLLWVGAGAVAALAMSSCGLSTKVATGGPGTGAWTAVSSVTIWGTSIDVIEHSSGACFAVFNRRSTVIVSREICGHQPMENQYRFVPPVLPPAPRVEADDAKKI